MKPNFDRIKVVVCSDEDYDKLIAEIYIDENFVALVSQEQGLDQLVVEFPPDLSRKASSPQKIPFELLVGGLGRAKEELQR